MPRAPGNVRDSIVGYLTALKTDATVSDISAAVTNQLGDVPQSSIRSYLNLNTPDVFERTNRGRYRLRIYEPPQLKKQKLVPVVEEGKAKLFQADCFDWLTQCQPYSYHAVVTDPPYGLLEYSEKEQAKLESGKGGVWRIPPSFDGHKRAPLPRFTVLDQEDRAALSDFFERLGSLLVRVTVPGANILVASNPLLAHIVAIAMVKSGLELRGNIVRLVMTMRGGDRPKNAHQEFHDVSVIPRAMWEPWVMLRRPPDGRIQDNLRRWKTGGFRRPSADRPFGDVIKSSPTQKKEREIAPHPSLKPQAFLRQVVRAALPLGKGVILDPFAGSGSTLAAANAIGYESVGIESNARYVKIAAKAVRELGKLQIPENPVVRSFEIPFRSSVAVRVPSSPRGFRRKSETVTWPR